MIQMIFSYNKFKLKKNMCNLPELDLLSRFLFKHEMILESSLDLPKLILMFRH